VQNVVRTSKLIGPVHVGHARTCWVDCTGCQVSKCKTAVEEPGGIEPLRLASWSRRLISAIPSLTAATSSLVALVWGRSSREANTAC
jgi:hypothetical protein